MIDQLIFLGTILLIGWLICVAPSQYILPFFIGKQLSTKDLELENRFKKISFIEFNKRYEFVEKTLKSLENSEFLKENYFGTFLLYKWAKRIWIIVMVVIIVGTIITQVIQGFKFISDPKGQMEKIRNTANSINLRK